jgi:proline dehydrogenase
MSLLNTVVVKTLPLVPKKIVRKFANRYIAGDKIEDAVIVSKNLNFKNIHTTIDVLGEDVHNISDAKRAKNECEQVLDAIRNNNLKSGLSIKLTSLGLKIDKEFCLSNVNEIFNHAKKHNIFVRIDMEDSSCTDDTIDIFLKASQNYKRCGIVLQAYLKRTYDDAIKLIQHKTDFRLCKGIYIESPEIAFKEKQQIRDNFIKVLRLMLENECYTGIATHDDYLIDESYKLIKELNIEKSRYEFQMLLGVRDKLRDKIVCDGHKMRIYVPFGTHWYQYSIRRFKENPQMAGYVLKSILRRGN